MARINTQNPSKLTGTWLVTGASSGIGAELAVLLGREVQKLILVGQNESRLQETAQRCLGTNNPDVQIVIRDLRVEHAGRDLGRLLLGEGQAFAGMILAAGATDRRPVASSNSESICDQIQLNSLEHGELLHELAAPMVARGAGKILLVASMAGFFGIPGQAAYSASKAWLVSLGCALHHEFRSQGVDLTTLCPGATQTRFFERAGIPQDEGWAQKASWQTAEDVAHFGLKALHEGRILAVPHWRNRALLACMRFLSRTRISSMVTKELQEL